MSEHPELATLEHLISERSHGQAQVIIREIFDQLRNELAAAAGQDLGKIDFREEGSLDQELSLISDCLTPLVAQRLALQMAKEIIGRSTRAGLLDHDH